MASSGYERIPTSDVDAPGSQSASLRHRSQSRSRASSPPAAPPASLDARFERPVPAAWKRVALLLFVALLFYLSFALGKLSHPTRQPLPKVVHASRYSRDYKFRPAASPVITERMKDGRVRVRGALPTGGQYVPAQP